MHSALYYSLNQPDYSTPAMGQHQTAPQKERGSSIHANIRERSTLPVSE